MVTVTGYLFQSISLFTNLLGIDREGGSAGGGDGSSGVEQQIETVVVTAHRISNALTALQEFLLEIQQLIQDIASAVNDLNEGKNNVCSRVPDGRVTGGSGAIGGIGSVVGGGETVLNYNTGQSSMFFYGGMQGGWNGGLQGTAYSGFAYGLSGNNSNYSGGFTSLSGGDLLGGFVSSSSGGLVPGAGGMLPNGNVTVYGANISANLTPTIPSGGASVTQYSNPIPLSPLATLANMDSIDAAMMAAKAACNG